MEDQMKEKLLVRVVSVLWNHYLSRDHREFWMGLVAPIIAAATRYIPADMAPTALPFLQYLLCAGIPWAATRLAQKVKFGPTGAV